MLVRHTVSENGLFVEPLTYVGRSTYRSCSLASGSARWAATASSSAWGAASLGFNFHRHDRANRIYVYIFPNGDGFDADTRSGRAPSRSDSGGNHVSDISQRSTQGFDARYRRIREEHQSDYSRYPDNTVFGLISMPDENFVFTAVSMADFGFREVFLTAKGADHITLRGHRDLGASPHRIREAIEQATYVVAGNRPHRLVFYSTAIVNKSGRPMAVVIERVSDRGKVITATWKDKVPSQKIWDATNGFYIDFDEESDVLYISMGAAVDAYAVENEDDRDIWYRKADVDDSPVGVTIFGAKERETKDRSWIARIASEFLGVAREQLEERLVNVMVLPTSH